MNATSTESILPVPTANLKTDQSSDQDPTVDNRIEIKVAAKQSQRRSHLNGDLDLTLNDRFGSDVVGEQRKAHLVMGHPSNPAVYDNKISLEKN